MSYTNPLEAMRHDDRRIQAAIAAVPTHNMSSYEIALARAEAATAAKRVFQHPIHVTDREFADLQGLYSPGYTAGESAHTLKMILRELYAEVPKLPLRTDMLRSHRGRPLTVPGTPHPLSDYDRVYVQLENEIRSERQQYENQTRRLKQLKQGQMPLPRVVGTDVGYAQRHKRTLKQIHHDIQARYPAP